MTARELNQIADITTILSLYGIRLNRAGFIRCIAHNENTPSMKVYTYESGNDGRHKVVNEWICESVDIWHLKRGIPVHLPKAACVPAWEIREYRDKKRNSISEMHISDLKIYDTPRELSDFKTPDKPYHRIIERDGCLMFADGYESGKPLTRAPQSWQYVEEE